MAYPYAVQRYREIQGWVPSVDIDGIDAKEQLIADTENTDFHNGFISNAVKPVEHEYDLDIEAIIAGGYEVLSVHYFYHKDRGDCEFYLMYKEISAVSHDLRFIIKDDSDYEEVLMDEQSDDTTLQTKPTDINYAYIDGQLKINLNVGGEYSQLYEDGNPFPVATKYNLTLVYLEDKGYTSATQREAGWYIFPRYLGWSYPNGVMNTGSAVNTLLDLSSKTAGAASEVIGDNGITYGISPSWDAGAGSALFALATTSYYSISGVNQASGFRIKYFAGSELTVRVKDLATNEIVYQTTLGATYEDNINGWTEVTVVFPVIVNAHINIQRESATGTIYVDEIELHYIWKGEYCVIARYDDNQRGLIETGEGVLSSTVTMRVEQVDIDWRVKSYEIYYQLEEDGLFTMIKEVSLMQNNSDRTWIAWTSVSTYYEFSNVNLMTETDYELDLESSETLNFNYGLGSSVKAFYSTGFTISQEISYRHRQYYVRGDDKLHMSHIAGSGLAQPDSFPYNEDVSFGYLITEENERNLALAVTPLDELIIMAENKSYVYYMQIVNSTVVRKIKAINGSVGVLSSKTLAVDSSGHSSGMNLFWIDKQGCYLYAGGREEPKSVSNNTHRNYWLEVLTQANKEAGLLAYNRMKREFWFQVGSDIIIYEEMYGRFKKYKFDFTIVEFLGTRSDKFYMLASDGLVYVIDYTSSERLDAMIQTHPSTNTIIIGQYPISAWEWQHKIMQDLYVVIKDRRVGLVNYTLIPDEIEMEVIKLSTNSHREVVPSPLLVRYGKVAIKLEIPATLSKVKEFGYSFSVPSQGVGDLLQDQVGGIGQSVGTSLGVQQ